MSDDRPKCVSMRSQIRALHVELLEPRFALSGPSQPTVAMTLEVVDDSGVPIAVVAPGQNFKVQVFVQDLRVASQAKGVFSAYADLLFDADIVEPLWIAPIAFGNDYAYGHTGDTLTKGVINELGAIATDLFTGLDSQNRLLAEVHFHAKSAGNPDFRLDPPDQSVSDILVFQRGLDEELAVDDVVFGSCKFEVIGNNRSAPDSQYDDNPPLPTQPAHAPSSSEVHESAIATLPQSSLFDWYPSLALDWLRNSDRGLALGSLSPDVDSNNAVELFATRNAPEQIADRVAMDFSNYLESCEDLARLRSKASSWIGFGKSATPGS